jgi:hypothetical protein
MSQSFPVGNRVQIASDWFVIDQRGAIGTIIDAPDGVTHKQADGVYWVAFDLPVEDRNDGSFTDAAEINAAFLQPIHTDRQGPGKIDDQLEAIPSMCPKCGDQPYYQPAGPGGGSIVCPNCGIVGVYDCAREKGYWDKFTKKKPS